MELTKFTDINPIYIGTSGWSIPSRLKEKFNSPGTHLQRYSEKFNSVEINSSFYRDHRVETYLRWYESTPKNFRFSVKLAKYFTHEKRLEETGYRLRQTLIGISHLKEKWGVLLVQLPPSMKFQNKVAERFIGELRNHYEGILVWEPRHPSWTEREALNLFERYKINKVLADPEPCPVDGKINDSTKTFQYFRLHGSLEIYKSLYSDKAIAELAFNIQNSISLSSEVWVIFDNTTYGYATQNAMDLKKLLNK